MLGPGLFGSRRSRRAVQAVSRAEPLVRQSAPTAPSHAGHPPTPPPEAWASRARLGLTARAPVRTSSKQCLHTRPANGGLEVEVTLLGAVERVGRSYSVRRWCPRLASSSRLPVPTTDPDTTRQPSLRSSTGRAVKRGHRLVRSGRSLIPARPATGRWWARPSRMPGAPIRGGSRGFGVPAGIQTDVEAAAVADRPLGPSPGQGGSLRDCRHGVGAAVAVTGALAGPAPQRVWPHPGGGVSPATTIRDAARFPPRLPGGMSCGRPMAERWGVDPSAPATARRLAAGGRLSAQTGAGWPTRSRPTGSCSRRRRQPPRDLVEMIRLPAHRLGRLPDYSSGDERVLPPPLLGDRLRPAGSSPHSPVACSVTDSALRAAILVA